MEGLRIIREKINYSKYRMAQELKLPHSQYGYLEKKAQLLQIKILKDLRAICLRHGISEQEMLNFLEQGIK